MSSGAPGSMAEAAAGAPVDERPVVLVGLMGSGKSSLGRRLARRLGVPFVDSDAEIERRTGRRVADIIGVDGEAAFRRLEEDVLNDLVRPGRPAVVATGGGAVLSPVTRARLRDRGRVVWLRAAPEVLARRLTGDERDPRRTRPLLGADPLATLTAMAESRGPSYAEVATVVVDVDRGDWGQLLNRVAAAVTPTARGATS